MQAAAPAPRHRVYTAVEPRCEWARTADADTLVVDVSGAHLTASSFAAAALWAYDLRVF